MFDRDGRPVTRSEVISKTRVRVNRITALANDLALALAAPTIRIEAPVPGKPIVGIEVPNTTTSLVSPAQRDRKLGVPEGERQDEAGAGAGQGRLRRLRGSGPGKMPHLLIAGATGSGKSVCINSIIASFLVHNTPEELRLVLIDPKRVELTTYNRVPHLAFSKVIVDMDEVVGTLQAVIHEMDSRYRRFAEAGRPEHGGVQQEPAGHAQAAELGRDHRRAGRPDDGGRPTRWSARSAGWPSWPARPAST